MSDESKEFAIFGQAVQTATPGQLALARKYGERIEGRDGDCVVVGYMWDGKLFVE